MKTKTETAHTGLSRWPEQISFLGQQKKASGVAILSLILVLMLSSVTPTIVVGEDVYPLRSYQIDVSREGQPAPFYWNGTGFTPGSLLLRADMQLTLDYQSAIPNQGMRYVRPHWLLNMVTVRNPGTEDAVYNYDQLFAALDQLIDRGMKPIFEIMGFPRIVDTEALRYDADAQGQQGRRNQWVPDFEQRPDYLLWHDFILDLFGNLEDRYGVEELKSWYFESTNEPDIHEWFWDQGIPALLNYWDATSAAIKATNPGYRFGGPGTATVLSDEFKAVIAHCESGTHAITGETGSVLDFISVHAKNKPYEMIDMERRSINWIREHHPGFQDLPFWNNEADPTWGWRRPFWWRPTSWYAGFIIQSVDAHNRLLIDATDINYGMLVNDKGFLGDWHTRSALARFANPDNQDLFWMIKKPVHNAMSLLAHMQGQRLVVEGLHGERDHVSILARRRANGQILLLIASLPDFGPIRSGAEVDHPITPSQRQRLDGQGAIVSLSLDQLPFQRPVLSQFRIDGLHSNPYEVWQQVGSPESLDIEHYSLLADHMEPSLIQHRRPLYGQELEVFLPPSAVTMFIISESPEEPPSSDRQAQVTRVIPYQGMHGEPCQFIHWQQYGKGVVAYNIFASYDGADYLQINTRPILDLGFLHVLPDGVEDIRYRVEVLDL